MKRGAAKKVMIARSAGPMKKPGMMRDQKEARIIEVEAQRMRYLEVLAKKNVIVISRSFAKMQDDPEVEAKVTRASFADVVAVMRDFAIQMAQLEFPLKLQRSGQRKKGDRMERKRATQQARRAE